MCKPQTFSIITVLSSYKQISKYLVLYINSHSLFYGSKILHLEPFRIHDPTTNFSLGTCFKKQSSKCHWNLPSIVEFEHFRHQFVFCCVLISNHINLKRSILLCEIMICWYEHLFYYTIDIISMVFAHTNVNLITIRFTLEGSINL